MLQDRSNFSADSRNPLSIYVTRCKHGNKRYTI